jgi:hypothetical protein
MRKLPPSARRPLIGMSGRLWAPETCDGRGLSAPRTHDAPLTARPRKTPVTDPAATQATRFPAKLAPAEILPPVCPRRSPIRSSRHRSWQSSAWFPWSR